MKASLTTSALVHAALLVFALVSLGSPAPLDFANVEAMPVELVPIEELSQMQQGDKKAPKTAKSAPISTTRPDVIANAVNAGNNTADLAAPTPSTKPSEVKEIAKEKTAPPPREMAPLPTQKPETAPQKPAAVPLAEQKAHEPAEIALPTNPPRPDARPRLPEQKPEPKPPAEKPSDRKAGEKKQKTGKAIAQASEFNAAEISALLNKQTPSGGGAKRSSKQASLGGKKIIGTALSANEIDNVKSQIQSNWSMMSGLTGVADVRVTIKIVLDRSGNIVGAPQVTAVGGPEGTRRAVEGSTRRAVLRSAPLKNLPVEKYDGNRGWNELVLTFDPSEFAL